MKTFIISLIRMFIVGGASLAVVLYQIDNYLKSSYGIENIYILVFVCSFIPLLFTLTVEFYCWFGRRDKQKKNNNTVYLKETITKKTLTR
ncbi:hypothetical protein CON36_36190 [Bacillus cereus]|uniref:Uncharacterized protein n=2 Tax=Bacillus cereus group TaxID=86661 RepID=A0A9X6XUM9_BACCE|nr:MULTISPECIES: hypothetical protein [Bacillus cereus group]PDZ93995.1 hypothetical protein CON36_36190 [Bacillus cereus]PFJ29165.1 hypothetical protein COJ15_32135 [Bacillus thuringiensis]